MNKAKMKVNIFAIVGCEVQQEQLGREIILGEDSMDAPSIEKTPIVDILGGLMQNFLIERWR